MNEAKGVLQESRSAVKTVLREVYDLNHHSHKLPDACQDMNAFCRCQLRCENIYFGIINIREIYHCIIADPCRMLSSLALPDAWKEWVVADGNGKAYDNSHLELVAELSGQ